MFSLKEWNFEEYKAAVNEIQDSVERMDEIGATYSIASDECYWSDNYYDIDQESEHQNKLINKRFKQFEFWAQREIELIKHEYSREIENIKKKAWKGPKWTRSEKCEENWLCSWPFVCLCSS